MAQVGNAAEHNEKEIMTRYPIEEGLTAGTQKQEGRVSHLVPLESSLVPQRHTIGVR